MASATGISEVAAIIRAMDEQFVRNVKANDANRLVEDFYAEDARLMPPNQPVLQGKAAIRGLWSAFLPAIVEMTLDTTHVDASGDLAYGVGQYTMKLTPPGGQPSEDRGKYTVVYRRQPDRSWRAVVDMFSSNGPG